MRVIDQQSEYESKIQSVLEEPGRATAYLDLEADNFHHYNEILCTVQGLINGDYFLLDTLSLEFGDEFRRFLQETTIWMHGCDYDLFLFRKFVGEVPTVLYDTQIAARLCGYKKFGYASLVEQICEVKLSKESQREDWTKRPLPEKMVEYAKNDVHYLPVISDYLTQRLKHLGRWEWFVESCEANKQPPLEEEIRDSWRIGGSGSFSSNELRYLKALWEWRDTEAEKIDKPAFKVTNNQQLLSWSKSLTLNEEIKIPKGFRTSRKENLLAAIEVAQSVPEADWPSRNRGRYDPTPKVSEKKLKTLMEKRDNLAEDLGIDPTLIAPRKALEAILRDESAASNLMFWQRELLQF